MLVRAQPLECVVHQPVSLFHIFLQGGKVTLWVLIAARFLPDDVHDRGNTGKRQLSSLVKAVRRSLAIRDNVLFWLASIDQVIKASSRDISDEFRKVWLLQQWIQIGKWLLMLITQPDSKHTSHSFRHRVKRKFVMLLVAPFILLSRNSTELFDSLPS